MKMVSFAHVGKANSHFPNVTKNTGILLFKEMNIVQLRVGIDSVDLGQERKQHLSVLIHEHPRSDHRHTRQYAKYEDNPRGQSISRRPHRRKEAAQ